ncbi:MAG: GNAT family N-acetyltransferase [Betaproteobacteria bacterium]|nr:GNAT family N-acetyltransferase [Betaproteobacteria bacterium]
MSATRGRRRKAGGAPLRVRRAAPADLAQVIDIDQRATGLAKPQYWAGILRRYGRGGARRRFLVAESGARILGYIVGEVRDWEFGSPPCGWIFGIGVRPEEREAGVASAMLAAIAAAFRRLGVTTVRTLIARDNRLVLSFFRSQGMMAAPVIPLEKEIG